MVPSRLRINTKYKSKLGPEIRHKLSKVSRGPSNRFQWNELELARPTPPHPARAREEEEKKNKGKKSTQSQAKARTLIASSANFTKLALANHEQSQFPRPCPTDSTVGTCVSTRGGVCENEKMPCRILSTEG